MNFFNKNIIELNIPQFILSVGLPSELILKCIIYATGILFIDLNTPFPFLVFSCNLFSTFLSQIYFKQILPRAVILMGSKMVQCSTVLHLGRSQLALACPD